MKKLDMQISKITVIGGGSWGTALAALLAGKKYPASVLVREFELARSINERMKMSRYLPGLKLPEGLVATTSEAEALDETDLIVWAIPCQSSREAMRKLRPISPAILWWFPPPRELKWRICAGLRKWCRKSLAGLA
jgi:Glycerol-3-phosphate dehydrogenase